MGYFNYYNCILTNGVRWEIAKALFDFNSKLYVKACEQSKRKSQFTMDSSQAGKYRSPGLKYQMQLMGILAEIYSQEYLKEIIRSENLSSQWEVMRYDDVRTDGFRSAANEYDIKIKAINGAKEFTVESRSSIAHNRSLKSAIEQFDIIGPYSSVVKPGESLTGFFIRPLYEFLPFSTKSYLPGNFENHLKAQEINLHIVAGCAKKEMNEIGYNKSMNQTGTRYRVIKILQGYDVKNFRPILIDKLK